MDSLEHCLDKKHFLEYSYPVDYQYNSRGFRDEEWPDSLEELQEAVWCVGDSFTVGIGQPYLHIWPQVLSRRLQMRMINISMDGASNDWIGRRALDIMQQVRPRCVIVMWSYTHRREHADSNRSDENRKIYAGGVSQEQDLLHWQNLVNRLRNQITLGDYLCDLIQCTIPDFHPNSDQPYRYNLADHWDAIKGADWPRCPESLGEFDALPEYILQELENLHGCYLGMRDSFDMIFNESSQTIDDLQSVVEDKKFEDIIYIRKRLDWARDYHHFDILTSEWVVDRILEKIPGHTVARNDPLAVSADRSHLR